MNNECNVIRITAAGNTYRCNRLKEHAGDHRRTNANGTYVIYSWPQAEPPKEEPKRCGALNGCWKCTEPKGHVGSHKAQVTSGEVRSSWPNRSMEHPSMFFKRGVPLNEQPSMYAKGGKVSDSEREWFAVKYPSYAAVVDKEVQKIKDDMAKVTAKIEKTQAKIEKELRKLEALEETPVLFSTHELAELYVILSGNHDIPEVYLNKIGTALKNSL